MITFSPKLSKIYNYLSSCYFEHSLWEYYKRYPVSADPFIFLQRIKALSNILVQSLEIKLGALEDDSVLRVWSVQGKGMVLVWQYGAGEGGLCA